MDQNDKTVSFIAVPCNKKETRILSALLTSYDPLNN